ncbi:MAG TPA: ABC transporter substrate-binding protein [Solirubrobacteraceae bacterium]|nr:ABC transporter substrate-binding protein [Solirubrobacteraceae bacterium]
MMRRKWLAAGAATILLAAAGCGDDGGGGGGDGDDTGGGKAIENAKQIDVGSMEGAKGEITYCQGKDTTGETKAWGKQFNEKHKSQGLSVKIVEFPASADEQRTQFVQRQEAKAGDCDVFRSDVIWTAEFASQGWLYDLTPYIEDRRDDFIQPSIDTATYEGKIWGVPHYTNAALLYYRKDKIDEAPATWQDVYQQAADSGGIVFQGAAYEGLTCDWLEIAYAAGGSVISEDGKEATIDSPENVAATKLMADAVKNGAAPKAVATYMEPESLTAWQTGKPAMMRNWPYAYGLSEDTPKLKGKFDVAPLPSFEGAGKAAILGGGNNVISVYSKNPGGALAVVDFLAQQDWQTQLTAEFSQASPLKATYDQPEVQKAIPFSDDLRTALEQAKPRPVSPVYPQISQAIYKNVNQALTGQKSPEDAMKQAQSDIEKALSTF